MRRAYLDWLRGVAVLIMIEAHTLDAWTRVDARDSAWYVWANILAGFGAPVFLFLAGAAMALACGQRLRNGMSDAEAAKRARRRGWQIFGLAFLFRLQSWLISGGGWPSLLKVDILNIMGLALLAAALLWEWGRSPRARAWLLTAAAVAVAMVTPLVRSAEWLAPLVDPIEEYLRPAPGRGTFSLFPWAGFVLAGGAIGLWLDWARTEQQERRANAALAGMGVAIALGGYAASLLPSIYAESNFWTSSPTFFFLRLGILITAVPVAYWWNALFSGWSPLREFGRSSLFVYWIHVEMVYGVVSTPLHRSLPFGGTVLAFALFSLFLYGLVRLKNQLTAGRLDHSALSPSRAGG